MRTEDRRDENERVNDPFTKCRRLQHDADSDEDHEINVVVCPASRLPASRMISTRIA